MSNVQFADKFAEYKEAARLAKEKSLEKMELASSPSQVVWTLRGQHPISIDVPSFFMQCCVVVWDDCYVVSVECDQAKS